jgi:hypothetical protein
VESSDTYLLLCGFVREVEPWPLVTAVQGQSGSEEVLPLPKGVKEAVDHYLRLDKGGGKSGIREASTPSSFSRTPTTGL